MIVTEPREEIEIHAQAEELAQILMKLQRCFLANLSAELSRGSVSFPQYFLLTYLEHKDVINMSEIRLRPLPGWSIDWSDWDMCTVHTQWTIGAK